MVGDWSAIVFFDQASFKKTLFTQSQLGDKFKEKIAAIFNDFVLVNLVLFAQDTEDTTVHSLIFDDFVLVF